MPSIKRSGGSVALPVLKRLHMEPAPAPTPEELIEVGISIIVSTGCAIFARFVPDATWTYWKIINTHIGKDGSQQTCCTGAYDAIKQRIREENVNCTKSELCKIICRPGCPSRLKVFNGAFIPPGNDDDNEDRSCVFTKKGKCSTDCVWNKFTVTGVCGKAFMDETSSRLLVQTQLFVSNGTMEKKKEPIGQWKGLYTEFIKHCKEYASTVPDNNMIATLLKKLPDLDRIHMDENLDENLDEYWAFIEYISRSCYDGYLSDDAYMTQIVGCGINGLRNQMRSVKSWTSRTLDVI